MFGFHERWIEWQWARWAGVVLTVKGVRHNPDISPPWMVIVEQTIRNPRSSASAGSCQRVCRRARAGSCCGRRAYGHGDSSQTQLHRYGPEQNWPNKCRIMQSFLPISWRRFKDNCYRNVAGCSHRVSTTFPPGKHSLQRSLAHRGGVHAKCGKQDAKRQP